MATWRVSIGQHGRSGLMSFLVSKPDVNVNTTVETHRGNLIFSSEWDAPTAMVLQSGVCNQDEQVLFADPGYTPCITFARRSGTNTFLEGEVYYFQSNSSGQRDYYSVTKWAIKQGPGRFTIHRKHPRDATTGAVFRYIIWSLPTL